VRTEPQVRTTRPEQSRGSRHAPPGPTVSVPGRSGSARRGGRARQEEPPRGLPAPLKVPDVGVQRRRGRLVVLRAETRRQNGPEGEPGRGLSSGTSGPWITLHSHSYQHRGHRGHRRPAGAAEPTLCRYLKVASGPSRLLLR